jgi:hypothetical protein
MRTAAATGKAPAPRFERVGIHRPAAAGPFLAYRRFMTVTTGFWGALAREYHARPPKASTGALVENQQRLAGPAAEANRQEPLQKQGSCSSRERATAGAIAEV